MVSGVFDKIKLVYWQREIDLNGIFMKLEALHKGHCSRDTNKLWRLTKIEKITGYFDTMRQDQELTTTTINEGNGYCKQSNTNKMGAA